MESLLNNKWIFGESIFLRPGRPWNKRLPLWQSSVIKLGKSATNLNINNYASNFLSSFIITDFDSSSLLNLG